MCNLKCIYRTQFFVKLVIIILWNVKIPDRNYTHVLKISSAIYFCIFDDASQIESLIMTILHMIVRILPKLYVIHVNASRRNASLRNSHTFPELHRVHPRSCNTATHVHATLMPTIGKFTLFHGTMKRYSLKKRKTPYFIFHLYK